MTPDLEMPESRDRDEVRIEAFLSPLKEIRPARVGQQRRVARPRRNPVRFAALAGAAAVAAGAILIGIGSGGGPGGQPEAASAADLLRLARIAPHLMLAGMWQITSTEGSPEGGRTEFRQTKFVFPNKPHPRPQPARAATLRWQSIPLREGAAEVASEGFVPVGTLSMLVAKPYLAYTEDIDRILDRGRARVYVSRAPGRPVFTAVALWREAGWTFALRTSVPNLRIFEVLTLSRLNSVDASTWLLALQPRGTELVAASELRVDKKEAVKIGERPDGRPIYRVRTVVEPPRPGETPVLDRPIPIVFRDGDTVRVVVRDPTPGAPPQAHFRPRQDQRKQEK